MLGSKPKNKLQPQAKSDLYPVSYEQFSHFERFVKELKKNKEGKKKHETEIINGRQILKYILSGAFQKTLTGFPQCKL